MGSQSDEGGRSAPGLGDLFDRILGEERGVRDQIDRNARALAQSALAKLDVVSRDEFDAQTAVLARTRDRVEALEKEIERLTELLNQSSS